jgi:hypothetical protein
VLFFSASTSLFNAQRRSSPHIKYLSIAPLLNVVLMAISAITNKTKPQQYIEKLNTLLGL